MGPYAFSQAFLCGFFAFTVLSSLVETLLERQGYSVLSSESGEEALDVAARQHSRIDLVLTEVGMATAVPSVLDRVRERQARRA